MKLKNIFLGAVGAAMTLAAASCSNIDEDERLVYVKPAEVGRAVLIEDFTGQRCVNCPDGTNAINAIMETYGEDNIIAVGIHSGPLGFAGNANVLGLMTDTGEEYYKKYGISSQPSAMFNRSVVSNNYNTWAAYIPELISQKANLSIAIGNAYDESSRTLTTDIDAFGTNGTTNGKLQVWLIEDGIVALQLMPDGSANANYVHNHVFRAAVNGTWGESVTVKEGEHTKKQYTYTLPSSWKAENVSVVAFVYNDSGVEQAAKAHVTGESVEQ